LNGGEEVVRALVVSRGDAAEVFESAEHALDRIPAAVGDRIVRVRVLAGRVWRDDGFTTMFRESVTQLSRVIGSIRQKFARRRR
jgi:hypothetical protein